MKRFWWALGITLILFLLTLVVERKVPEWGRKAALAETERRGDLCFQKGKTKAAEGCWRPVLQELPGAVSVRNKLAVLWMNGGRFKDAREILEEGIRKAPETASFHYNIGLLCYMEGDYRNALASLSEVERISPGHAKVHFLKGVIYDELGLDELARKEFIKELNLDPATTAAWARLGAFSSRTWKIPGLFQ